MRMAAEDPATTDPDEAAAAFGSLADPTRVAILLAFTAVVDDREVRIDDGMPVISFSELYDRVEVDSTSKLSYHLGELEGTYLRRVEDGWTFTFTGETVARSILAGTYDGEVAFDPVDVDAPCLHCGSQSLEVRVEDRLLRHDCLDCGEEMGGIPVTPAQVRERDVPTLLESTTTYVVGTLWQHRNGFCSDCGGVVEVTVEPHPVADAADTVDRFVAVGTCRSCRRRVNGPPSMWLANHPACVSFHWDYGVDVLSMGMQDVGETVGSDRWTTERIGTDPPRYEVAYRAESSALRLVVDDSLTVIRTERVRRSSPGDR